MATVVPTIRTETVVSDTMTAVSSPLTLELGEYPDVGGREGFWLQSFLLGISSVIEWNKMKVILYTQVCE